MCPSFSCPALWALLTRTWPLTWLPFQLTAVSECLFAIVMAMAMGCGIGIEESSFCEAAALCPLPHHYGLPVAFVVPFSPPSFSSDFPGFFSILPIGFCGWQAANLSLSLNAPRIENLKAERFSRPEVATAAGCIDNHVAAICWHQFLVCELSGIFCERRISISVRLWLVWK